MVRTSGRRPVPGTSLRRTSAVYLTLVLLPVGVAIWLLHFASDEPVHSAVEGLANEPSGHLTRVLLATVTIVALAGALGAVCRALGQSPVMGEMIAGILLGPSVLGAISPGLENRIFGIEERPLLTMLAQVGVIFFMFQIGLELPLAMLRRVGRLILPISHAAIAVPFVLGVIVALSLERHYRPEAVGGLPFVMFVALAMSVTAFPVLARILADRNLTGSRLGTLGLAAAGVGDVTAWCVLAVVVASVRQESPLGLLMTIIEIAAFSGLMWFVVRPALAAAVRHLERSQHVTSMVGPLLVVFVLASAMLTDAMQVHAIFGAFLAGVVTPRSSRAVTAFGLRTEGLTMWLLLPLFFATVGLNTRLQEVFVPQAMLPLVSVLVIAIVGKVAGAGLAARWTGESRRAALGLGVMMNCRGLTELIVLNIGLSLGIIDSDLFSILVFMTLITTLMTDPLLRLFRFGGTRAEARAVTASSTSPVVYRAEHVPVDVSSELGQPNVSVR
jgi:Kef-type K+ transport system membrane component KefB